MRTEDRKRPPGPEKQYQSTEDLLQWLTDQFKIFGNIFSASIYGADAYVVSHPAWVQHVLRKNWQNYGKGLAIKRVGLLLGSGLMVSEGDFWRNQRRMIQPAFDHAAIGALTVAMAEANRALLAKWQQSAERGETVNVTRDVSLMVLDMVLVAIFGDDTELVAPHFGILSDQAERDLPFAQAFRSLGRVVAETVALRRQQARRATDILGLLMEARDHKSGQVMSERQLVWEILTLIVAGHETTASTLNWIWYLLSQHPVAEARLADELQTAFSGDVPAFDTLARAPYARQVIEEALRLYPPGWLMTRRARRDDWIGGYFVPAGTEIYISPYLIQRHPDYWEAADEFRPDRFQVNPARERQSFAMLPFSAGPRNCIGEYFARVEMQVHLVMIARRLRLCGIGEPPPELEAGVNLRSRRDVILRPELRGTP